MIGTPSDNLGRRPQHCATCVERLILVERFGIRRSHGSNVSAQTAWGLMSDFIVALGLVFVLEGIAFAAWPGPAKRAVGTVLATPENTLRVVGLVSAVIGLIVVWLVRG